MPLDAVLPGPALHGFCILDDEQVIVETLHAEASTRDLADVALYNRVADALWSVAVTGDRARHLIQNAAHTLRERHTPGL